MADDDTVRSAVERALTVLAAAPDGWLPLGERRRLRAVSGPWTEWQAPRWPTVGTLRRAELYAACARRALPVFEAAFPGDRRPRPLIDETLTVIRARERENDEVSALFFEDLRDTVEPLGANADDARARVFVAGEAALDCCWASFDGDLDPESHPPEAEDRDLDDPWPDAVAAYALAWQDPEGYRAYWRWYITEAVPAALVAVADERRGQS